MKRLFLGFLLIVAFSTTISALAGPGSEAIPVPTTLILGEGFDWMLEPASGLASDELSMHYGSCSYTYYPCTNIGGMCPGYHGKCMQQCP